MKTNVTMRTLLVCCFFLCIYCSGQLNAQLINGKIIVSTEDKEGVAVFNTFSSNKWTATDKDGYFSIDVALNDVIQFSALQFQDFTVTINQKIYMRSKRLTSNSW
jgi:hypothetical protein